MKNSNFLNEALADQDDFLTAQIDVSDQPLVIIFSLPRGASTLFQQIAISSLDIGYVSNLIAKFWRAPYIGAQLDSSVRDPEYISNFKSSYGNVVGPQEPHEWGWFWQHWLKLGGNETYCKDKKTLDLVGLRQKLGALQSLWQRPFLIDSVFAIANYSILEDIMPKTLAVHVRRDNYYVCNSHINARIKRHGNIFEYYGHRPKNIKQILAIKDPIEQIVVQVKSAETEIEKTLLTIEASKIFQAEYWDLVEQPQMVMDNFKVFLEGNSGIKISNRQLPKLNLEFRDGPEFVNPEYKEKLDTYYELHFGGRS
jgi:hypothetical protein